MQTRVNGVSSAGAAKHSARASHAACCGTPHARSTFATVGGGTVASASGKVQVPRLSVGGSTFRWLWLDTCSTHAPLVVAVPSSTASVIGFPLQLALFHPTTFAEQCAPSRVGVP